jgi:hypothetical protein
MKCVKAIDALCCIKTTKQVHDSIESMQGTSEWRDTAAATTSGGGRVRLWTQALAVANEIVAADSM